MVDETIKLIVSRMNTMTDQEREKVMCALLNRYCVACGAAGDWSESPCGCDPSESHTHEVPKEERQLWLIYDRRAA